MTKTITLRELVEDLDIKIFSRNFLGFPTHKHTHESILTCLILDYLCQKGIIERYLDVKGYHYNSLDEIPNEIDGQHITPDDINVVYASLI